MGNDTLTLGKALDDHMKTLGKALDGYTKAVAELREAREELQRAHRREISALNAVNNSQKEIDQHLISIRKAAPSGSDWSHWSRALVERPVAYPDPARKED